MRTQIDRVIGNAVCVNMASAICRQIKADVYQAFWEAHGRPDTARFWRLWREAHPVPHATPAPANVIANNADRQRRQPRPATGVEVIDLTHL